MKSALIKKISINKLQLREREKPEDLLTRYQ
jgi:hypothetical protein